LELAACLKKGIFLVVDDFDSMRKVTINQLKQLGAVKIRGAARPDFSRHHHVARHGWGSWMR